MDRQGMNIEFWWEKSLAKGHSEYARDEMWCRTTFYCSYLVKVPLKEVCWQWPSCPDSREKSSRPGSYVEFSSAVVCSPMHLPVDSGQRGQVKWFHLYKSYSYLNHRLGLIGLTVYEACLEGIKVWNVMHKTDYKICGKVKKYATLFYSHESYSNSGLWMYCMLLCYPCYHVASVFTTADKTPLPASIEHWTPYWKNGQRKKCHLKFTFPGQKDFAPMRIHCEV